MSFPSLEAIVQMTGSYGPFVAVALATFLLLETFFRTLARKRRESIAVNSRLRVIESTGDGQEALVELRRRRGLSEEGGYTLPFEILSKLAVQSGVEIRSGLLIAATLATTVIVTISAHIFFVSLPLALLIGAGVGLLLPIAVLCACRRRRLKKLEEQLPEAVDVMVRSLRAGHPIAVAVALVAREMPDPVGTEFGLVADEMTYGLDLQTAMGNLRERTGQMDVALLVVAVAIQAKSGGNLAETLSNLGRMLRERSRMRRKIHALSAEGRISSLALSAVPIVVAGIVNITTPSFFNDVKNDPVFMPAVYIGIAIWIIGVVTIRRMVNFRI